MKILMSIYNEEVFSDDHFLVFSEWVSTDWSIAQIQDYLELYEGFRSELTVGQNLSFWDIFCFYEDIQELIAKIKKIPIAVQENMDSVSPMFLRANEYDSNSEKCIEDSEDHNLFLYSIGRFECGASGYESIVYWMSAHPVEMMFIGGLVYDACKSFLGKVLEHFNIQFSQDTRRPVFLMIRQFYKNFEKITHIKAKECQIVKLKRMKTGVFSLIVRTSTNKQYKVQSLATGKIKSLEIIGDKER